MKKKILILIFILFLFFSVFLTAEVLTKVKTFDNSINEVTIRDDLDNILIKTRLTSPQTNMVHRGDDVLVASFLLSDFKVDSGCFDTGMEMYDLKNNNKNVFRDYQYKYEKLVSYNEDVYKLVCSKEETLINGSVVQNCSRVYDRTLSKVRTEWIPFSNFSELPSKNIRIGLFTDVKKGDYIEFVPSFCGVDVPEYASWKESYEAGLSAWYQLNETSGTNAVEFFNGHFNISVNDSWASGLIGNGFQTNGGLNAYTNDGLNFSGNSTFSVSFWIKKTAGIDVDGWVWRIGAQNTNGDAGMRVKQATDALSPRAYDNSGAQVGTDVILTLNEWTHVVSVYNSSTNAIYVNNTLMQYDALTSFTPNANEITFFAFPASEFLDNSIVDEIGIWGRSLSVSEISDLYNSKAGITPVVVGLSLNITYPLNSNYSGSLTTLNYTFAGDDASTSTCWGSHDNGVTNTSSVTCGTNITGLYTKNGQNNFTLYINSSSDKASASVVFTGDNITTNVTINSPSASGTSKSIIINITAYDDIKLNNCTYNITRGASSEIGLTDFNITTAPSMQTNVTLSSYSSYVLHISCYDHVGNQNYTSFNFEVAETPPIVVSGGGGGFDLPPDFWDIWEWLRLLKNGESFDKVSYAYNPAVWKDLRDSLYSFFRPGSVNDKIEDTKNLFIYFTKYILRQGTLAGDLDGISS
jgi:hypothetical protein